IRALRPLDFVHEGAHEKDASPRSFQKILRVRRVFYLIKIEARAAIPDSDYEMARRASELYFDRLGLVLSVAVKHRVRHSLAHSHVNAEGSIAVESGAPHDFRCFVRRLRNALYAARQHEFGRLFGHSGKRGLSKAIPAGKSQLKSSEKNLTGSTDV